MNAAAAPRHGSHGVRGDAVSATNDGLGYRMKEDGPGGSVTSTAVLPPLHWIYETYHDKVLAYAAKLIGRSDADDVAQEVFIKIGRSIDGLKDPARLTSWIYSITLNTVRDAARRRSAMLHREASSAEPCCGEDSAEGGLEDLPDTQSETPEEVIMRDQMVACYLDYVDALPRNYYDVYVLAELEELTNEEIARRLSLTLGTVKIRLHRARAQLHGQLRRDCQCFYSDHGELMGRPKDGVTPPQTPPASARKKPRTPR